MNLTLIGMTGCGKSYWSRELERKCGFKRYCCDDLIEERLASQVRGRGIEAVRQMDGKTPRRSILRTTGAVPHPRRQGDGIDYTLSPHTDSEPARTVGTVIDTTGSIVYVDPSPFPELRELSKVVYFETPPEALEELYRRFLRRQKPIVWGDMFEQRESETLHEATARCYRELLYFRVEQYAKHAEITIPYHVYSDRSHRVHTLLEFVS